MNRQEAVDKVLSLFEDGYSCSQAVLMPFCERFGLDEETAKRIASTFGGGMGRLREKCGALTGAFMVLGLAYGNTDPKNMEVKIAAYAKVRDLDASIERIYGTTQCRDLLKNYTKESDVPERKHHAIICRKVVGDVAGLLYDMLEDRS